MGNSQAGLQVIERERGGDNAEKALNRILVENYNTMLPCYNAMSDEMKEQFCQKLDVTDAQVQGGPNQLTSAISMLDEDDAEELHELVSGWAKQ